MWVAMGALPSGIPQNWKGSAQLCRAQASDIKMVFTYLLGHEFPVFFPVISEILTARKFRVAEASGRVFLL